MPSSGVLLLSKRFATWLTTDDDFLHKFVKRLCGHPGPDAGKLRNSELSLLAAVVDKIPPPSQPWVLRRTLQNDRDRPEGKALLEDATEVSGFEGLAYYASSAMSDLGEHQGMATLPTKSNAISGSPEQKFITFQMSDRLGAGTTGRARTTSVTLPLATTVFQNGLFSTSLVTRWRGGKSGFELTAKAYDTEVSRLINFSGYEIETDDDRYTLEHDGYVHGAKITTPLESLVAFCSVEASMGNIISKIGIHTKGGKSEMPASEELEKAVQQLIESATVLRENFSVWALILPADMYHRSKLSDRNGLESRHQRNTAFQVNGSANMPDSLLWKGARLHRVLSGGGGWGKKSGLLSLDPQKAHAGSTEVPRDPTCETPHTASDFVEDIAKTGDMVGFYAAPNDFTPHRKTHVPNDESRIIASLDFGVLPSSMDELSSDMDSEVASDVDKRGVKTYPRHFGALSEGGMALHRSGHGSHISVLTKLDVPFARYSYQKVRGAPDRGHHTSSPVVIRTHPSKKPRPQSHSLSQSQIHSQFEGVTVRRVLADCQSTQKMSPRTPLVQKHHPRPLRKSANSQASTSGNSTIRKKFLADSSVEKSRPHFRRRNIARKMSIYRRYTAKNETPIRKMIAADVSIHKIASPLNRRTRRLSNSTIRQATNPSAIVVRKTVPVKSIIRKHYKGLKSMRRATVDLNPTFRTFPVDLPIPKRYLDRRRRIRLVVAPQSTIFRKQYLFSQKFPFHLRRRTIKRAAVHHYTGLSRCRKVYDSSARERSQTEDRPQNRRARAQRRRAKFLAEQGKEIQKNASELKEGLLQTPWEMSGLHRGLGKGEDLDPLLDSMMGTQTGDHTTSR